MAVGLVKLSKKQRGSLLWIIYAMNIIQIVAGSTMTGTSLYVCFVIAPLISSEAAEIKFLFAVYSIFGVNIIVNWVLGFLIMEKAVTQPQKKSTKGLLFLWYCSGTNCVITLIIIADLSIQTGKHIAKSMKNSIRGGMKSYLSDIDSKETIDKIQYELECCGIDSFKDWEDVEWMNSAIVNTQAALVDELRYDSRRLLLPTMPWSCCRIDYPMQCLHDPLQQTAFTNIWVDEPEAVQNSFNTRGCVEKMNTPLGWIIEGMTICISLVSFLHFVIFLASRILFTSCRNALLLYDIDGVAPGWVFGRGDCGYARGKTLTQIMGITNQMLQERMKKAKKGGKKSDRSEKSTISKATTGRKP